MIRTTPTGLSMVACGAPLLPATAPAGGGPGGSDSVARFAFDRALDNNADAQFVVLSQKDLVDSPASGALLEVGFTDAFRSLHPDTEAHPGPTHRNGRRIDQLYYKGRTLRNTSTRLISTWAPEFPSDHLLILSTFDLDHAATGPGRPVAPPQ